MGGKSSQKTTNRPAKFAQPSIDRALSTLQSGNAAAQDTYAQFRPAQELAINQIVDKIKAPPAYSVDARDQLGKTIRGEYLNSNPHADKLADLIAAKAQGNYNMTFGGSGRSRGGLAALLSQQGVGDALQSFYGGLYENERGRQQQAMGMAPAFNRDEYTPIEYLFPAVNQTAMGPLQAAAMYGQGVTNVTSPYGTQKTTQKQPFGLAEAIGLAAQVGSAIASGGATAPGLLASMPGMFSSAGAGGASLGQFGSLGAFLG